MAFPYHAAMDDEPIDRETLDLKAEELKKSIAVSAARIRETGIWPELGGHVYGEFTDGLEHWYVHDVGLIHSWVVIEGRDAQIQVRGERHVTELIPWPDVRNVEVSHTSSWLGVEMGRSEWILTIQYPVIRASRDTDAFREFALHVARLYSKHR